MVQVTGNIEPGFGEGGPWLSGLKCTAQIVVKSEKFVNLIEPTDPQNATARLHNVDFQWDEQSRNRLATALWQLDKKTQVIRVTIIGMLETRVPLDLLIDEHAPFKDRGFGHMGGAPAQILVTTIKNIRIVPKAK